MKEKIDLEKQRWEHGALRAETPVLLIGLMDSFAKEAQMDAVLMKIENAISSFANFEQQIEKVNLHGSDRDFMQEMLKKTVQSIESFYYFVLKIQLRKEKRRGAIIDELRVEKRILQKRIEELEGGWAKLEQLEGE